MCIFEKSASQNKKKTGFELTVRHVVFVLHDTLPFLLVIGRRNTIRKKQEKHEEKRRGENRNSEEIHGACHQLWYASLLDWILTVTRRRKHTNIPNK